MAAAPDGLLLVLALLVPLSGLPASLLLPARLGPPILLAQLAAGMAVAVALARAVLRAGAPITYALGGWQPPLGVLLRADGLSAVMLLASCTIVGAVALYSWEPSDDGAASRRQQLFWVLLAALWAGLCLVFLASDLFTLFVGLEILTFAAIPLVGLDGRTPTLKAALDYLVYALLGSLLYLLGVALIYGAHGVLDIGLLGARGHADRASLLAAALITAGLAAKSALWPLHFWLPPAHGGASPPVSALLSALVVKASVFLLLRLWFAAMPELPGGAAGQVLAFLGAAAVVIGGVQALRQERLKLLVAYSTVAQLGYLFIVFAFGEADGPRVLRQAWLGGTMQIAAHAVAKAAMFMAVGLMAEALGHDRIAGLGGLVRLRPVSLAAFAIGGMSLMGLPPSGGFVAKWFLLYASVASGRWWWGAAILTGGLFTGAYLYRVLAAAFATPATPLPSPPPDRRREAVVLALALASLGLGVLPLPALGLALIGGGP